MIDPTRRAPVALLAALLLSARADAAEAPAAAPVENADAAATSADPAAATPGGAALTELSLEEALARVDAANPTLAQARAKVRQAEGTVRMASAALQPIVAAQGGYTRNSHEAEVDIQGMFDTIAASIPFDLDIDTSGLPGRLVIQPLEQWKVAGSVQVPLVAADAWAQLASARHAAEAAEAMSEAVRLQVQGAVVQACLMARTAERFVEAQARTVETARAHRDSARRRLDAGLVTRLDVLRAETELARRESDLAQARAELDKVRLELGKALGVDGPVRVLPGEVEAPADPAALDAEGVAALARRAESARPELAAREAAVDAAHAALNRARLRHLPTLTGQFGALASDVELPTGEKWGWQAGLQLQWVLYDGGFRYGLARSADGQLAEARAALDEQRRGVRVEVEEALRDVAVAEERLRLAETRLDLARQAEASARRGYEAGLVDSQQALDAMDALALADVAHVQARANLDAARAKLRVALGEGW